MRVARLAFARGAVDRHLEVVPHGRPIGKLQHLDADGAECVAVGLRACRECLGKPWSSGAKRAHYPGGDVYAQVADQELRLLLALAHVRRATMVRVSLLPLSSLNVTFNLMVFPWSSPVSV